MSVCLCALLAYEVCGGPGVNIGPLAPVERPPPPSVTEVPVKGAKLFLFTFK